MGAGSKTALIQGHEESNCTGTGVITLSSSLSALLFHETSDIAIEVEFSTVNLEIYGTGDSFGENLLSHPCPIRPTLRKVDHGFLGPSKVKWSPSLIHRLFDSADIGIGILVEKL